MHLRRHAWTLRARGTSSNGPFVVGEVTSQVVEGVKTDFARENTCFPGDEHEAFVSKDDDPDRRQRQLFLDLQPLW